MKELQQLIDFAKAERAKAEKEAKDYDQVDSAMWAFTKGQERAFALIIEKAELLLAKQLKDDVAPPLQKAPVSRRVAVCGYCGSSLDDKSWLPIEETEELQQLRKAGQFDLVEGACCIAEVRLWSSTTAPFR